MRVGRPSGALAAWASVAITVLSRDASAGPMDPALSRLVADPSCLSPQAEKPCTPDVPSYRKLVSQWGFALAPAPAYGARTGGLGAIDVSLEASFTTVDDDADYWKRGTRGEASGPSSAVLTENENPDGLLPVYSLTLTKGFGFGLEASAHVGVTPSSSLVAWGAALRIVPFEGLSPGRFSSVPDFSLGAALREVSGMADLELSVFVADARLSRSFVVDRRQLVTPFAGYQWVRIHAEAPLVDLTPGVDGLVDCGYSGDNVPGGPTNQGQPSSGAPAGVYDGSPICAPGGGSDLDRSVSFGDATVVRHRLIAGVAYRREWLDLGLQLVTDLLSPGDAQSSGRARRELECDVRGDNCSSAPRQWTLSLQVGARF